MSLAWASVFPGCVVPTLSARLGRALLFETAEGEPGRAESPEELSFAEVAARIATRFREHSQGVFAEMRRYRDRTRTHWDAPRGGLQGLAAAVVETGLALTTPYPEVAQERVDAGRAALAWRAAEFARLQTLWEATDSPALWRAQYGRRTCCADWAVWWRTETWRAPADDGYLEADLCELERIRVARSLLASTCRRVSEGIFGTGQEMCTRQPVPSAPEAPALESPPAKRRVPHPLFSRRPPATARRSRDRQDPDRVRTPRSEPLDPSTIFADSHSSPSPTASTASASAPPSAPAGQLLLLRAPARERASNGGDASEARVSLTDGQMVGRAANALLAVAAVSTLGFLCLQKYRGDDAPPQAPRKRV
jgi:hypothetical protein